MTAPPTTITVPPPFNVFPQTLSSSASPSTAAIAAYSTALASFDLKSSTLAPLIHDSQSENGNSAGENFVSVRGGCCLIQFSSIIFSTFFNYFFKFRFLALLLQFRFVVWGGCCNDGCGEATIRLLEGGSGVVVMAVGVRVSRWRRRRRLWWRKGCWWWL